MVWKACILIRTAQKAHLGVSYRKAHISRVQFRSLSAYIWGASDGGQLGRISVDNLKPSEYPVDKELSHIGCGYGFTVVSEKTGPRLWMSGLNTSYQCGNNFSDVILEPYQLELPVEDTTTSITQISCGRSHTMVLTDKEGVFALGRNTQGQCGISDKNTDVVRDPQKIDLPEDADKIVKVVCGLDHSLFLTDTGKVFACGWGADGQTGQGHFDDEPCIKQVKGELDAVIVKDIASSADCCLALSDNGEVYSWGNSEYDQLGLETEEQQVAIATKAPLLCQLGVVKHVATAGSFCILITEEGMVYTWGYGVLGCGPDILSSKTPLRIETFDNIDEEITQAHCGTDHAALVTSSGKLFIWGRGTFGRLGTGTPDDQWTPKLVTLPGPVLEVSCGVDHMGVILQKT